MDTLVSNGVFRGEVHRTMADSRSQSQLGAAWAKEMLSQLHLTNNYISSQRVDADEEKVPGVASQTRYRLACCCTLAGCSTS